jgi:TRAP-type C4-dicarboxylate transport system permease small subunit
MWIVFIASPYTARCGGHLSMQEFRSLLPQTIRIFLQFISYAFAVVIFGIISASSIITTFNNRSTVITTLEIPFPVFFVPIVVGLSLLAIEYIIQFIRFLRNSKNFGKK